MVDVLTAQFAFIERSIHAPDGHHSSPRFTPVASVWLSVERGDHR
jgi:hypothetical protein